MKYPANKILVITTRRIGDVLLTTPLLRSLRLAYPEARIEALVFAGTAGVLEGNPDLDQVRQIPARPNRKQHWALLRWLWRRYDLAVSTLGGDRPVFYATLAAPRRVAVLPPWRWQDAWKHWLCHAHTELDNSEVHTVVQNLRLADLLDLPRCYRVVPPRPINPKRLKELLPFAPGTPYAVLHLLPMWHYKRWNRAAWLQLAAHLAHRHGLWLVLSGGPGEEEEAYLRAARAEMPKRTVNLGGRLSFGEVAALLENAALYVGPDTVVTHLAAAVGTPAIALYGPTNPLKWAPWPSDYIQSHPPFAHKNPRQANLNVILLQGEGDCVPCHEEGCERHVRSLSQCLEELAVARVIAEADALLAQRAQNS